MSNSLRPHESQHTRPPYPSPTPRVHSNSCPSSQWCHPAISSSVVPFSSCPQSLPAAESFPVSQLFAWGGQSTYWSFSFSIIPSKEIPELISLRKGWLDFIAVQGTLKSLFQHHSSKASILRCSAFFTVQLSHPYITIGETIALTRLTFVGEEIHWQEPATGVHEFSMLNCPPTPLPITSLWVIPVHHPQAPCLIHQTWTGDPFHIW